MTRAERPAAAASRRSAPSSTARGAIASSGPGRLWPGRIARRMGRPGGYDAGAQSPRSARPAWSGCDQAANAQSRWRSGRRPQPDHGRAARSAALTRSVVAGLVVPLGPEAGGWTHGALVPVTVVARTGIRVTVRRAWGAWAAWFATAIRLERRSTPVVAASTKRGEDRGGAARAAKARCPRRVCRGGRP